jgi:hypothetical protein
MAEKDAVECMGIILAKRLATAGRCKTYCASPANCFAALSDQAYRLGRRHLGGELENSQAQSGVLDEVRAKLKPLLSL